MVKEIEGDSTPSLHISPEMIEKEFILLCKYYSELGEQLKKFAILMTEYCKPENDDGS